jgi:F0F1-type ATP synthase membrane subunit b/b'
MTGLEIVGATSLFGLGLASVLAVAAFVVKVVEYRRAKDIAEDLDAANTLLASARSEIKTLRAELAALREWMPYR